MRYKVVVSYDGSQYQGFQRQKNGLGIQEIIEKAFKNMTKQSILIYSAGRTDKGVHAKYQVFHFDSDIQMEASIWKEGLNKRLPLDIRIDKVIRVALDFHARHHAKSKKYLYVIAKRESTVFKQRYEVYVKDFNVSLAQQAAKHLVGTHDFIGLSKKTEGKSTIKTIYEIVVKETKNQIIFMFHGNGFLRYMVRSMMGLICEVATGKKTLEDVDMILKSKERAIAVKTMESRGLYLYHIYY